MVIPDEVKQQLLYHYPNAKFKVKHGVFYTAELQELGSNQFYYGKFRIDNDLKLLLLHSDGSVRIEKTTFINFENFLLIKGIDYDADLITSSLNYGYLIEII